MTTHTETDRHDHPTVQALADQLSIPLLWALDAGKIAIDEVPTLERGQELLDWYGSAVEPLWEADQEARAVPLDCPVWCDRPSAHPPREGEKVYPAYGPVHHSTATVSNGSARGWLAKPQYHPHGGRDVESVPGISGYMTLGPSDMVEVSTIEDAEDLITR